MPVLGGLLTRQPRPILEAGLLAGGGMGADHAQTWGLYFTELRNLQYKHMSACSVTLVMPDSATSCSVVCQAPPSMGFSRQEYRRGMPCCPPGDLSNPGIKPVSPALQVGSFYLWITGEAFSKARVPKLDSMHYKYTWREPCTVVWLQDSTPHLWLTEKSPLGV